MPLVLMLPLCLVITERAAAAQAGRRAETATAVDETGGEDQRPASKRDGDEGRRQSQRSRKSTVLRRETLGEREQWMPAGVETEGESLMKIMHVVKEERTEITKVKKRKRGVVMNIITNTAFLATLATVLVILYAIKVRTQRYSQDVSTCLFPFCLLGPPGGPWETSLPLLLLLRVWRRCRLCGCCCCCCSGIDFKDVPPGPLVQS